MTEDAQPNTGPVSTDALDVNSAAAEIAAMGQPVEPEQEEIAETEAPEEEVELEVEAEETEAEPTVEDSEADPEEVTAEAEEEGEEEPDLPAIPAPHSWDKDAKAQFEALPREAQEIIAQRENARDKAVSGKLSEVAEQRKAYEAQVTQLAQYAQVFDQLAQQAQTQFADRWQGIDWTREAQSRTAEEYNQLRAQFEQDQVTLQQTQQAQAETAQAEQYKFAQEEAAKLQEIAPDLASSPEQVQAVTTYLTGIGIPQEAMVGISAQELVLAEKAMKYDALQAQSAPTKKRAEKPAPKAVKPQTSAKPKPRKSVEKDKAMKRLTRSGSVDDAVAAMLAGRN